MKTTLFLTLALTLTAGLLSSCQPSAPRTQIILLGQSYASGDEAVKEANNAAENAAGSGCNAISVGGFGAAGEGLLIGVPVLVDCPYGTSLLPDGTPAP